MTLHAEGDLGEEGDPAPGGHGLDQGAEAAGLKLSRLAGPARRAEGQGLGAQAVAFLEEHEALAVEVSLTNALALGEGVIVGGREEEGVTEEVHEGHVTELGLAGQEEEVELALGQARQEPVCVVLPEVELELGEALAEARHGAWEEVGSYGRDHAQPERAREGRAEGVSLVDEVGHAAEDLPGSLRELLSRRSRQDPALVALEELDSEDALELLELVAEGRLGHVAGLGCAAEVEVLGQGHEVFELTEGGLITHRRRLSLRAALLYWDYQLHRAMIRPVKHTTHPKEHTMSDLTNREGQQVPQVTFRTRQGSEWVDVTTKELFGGMRVVLFALPGAFTPTCSTSHLPRYEELFESFQAAGIDAVYCLSVNDTFVMNAWGDDQGVENVALLPDGNGEFSKGLGMLVDKDQLGFGARSWRYSMVVNDGTIEKMFIEDNVPGDPYAVSDADTMLSYLAPDAKAPLQFSLFTKPGCPHCARAKGLLQAKGARYEEIPLSRSVTTRTLEAVAGARTVPQVFLGGQRIGGADDLEAWYAAGSGPAA